MVELLLLLLLITIIILFTLSARVLIFKINMSIGTGNIANL